MRRILLGTLAAAAISVSTFTLIPAAAQSDQQWATDSKTLLHAKLAGMKAGLRLRVDQEPLWSVFQSAVEDVFKSHTEGGQSMSPVDRVARGAAERKTIADAAKPLYDSLDDTQKHNFELLGRATMHRPAAVEGHYEASGFSWEPSGWDE